MSQLFENKVFHMSWSKSGVYRNSDNTSCGMTFSSSVIPVWVTEWTSSYTILGFFGWSWFSSLLAGRLLCWGDWMDCNGILSIVYDFGGVTGLRNWYCPLSDGAGGGWVWLDAPLTRGIAGCCRMKKKRLLKVAAGYYSAIFVQSLFI